MPASSGQPFAYDEVPYPTLPFPETHPDRLGAVAHLHGTAVPPSAGCRYLELGCGDGGNLLALAAALPGATFTGVDLSGQAIERGTGVAERAGLTNVALHAADLVDPPDGLGEFDYVVAHGVYSWVPGPVRDALLGLTRRLLAPGGIAYVSYNALPGWHLVALHRALALRHIGDEPDPDRRVTRAREVLELVRELHATDDAYGRVLQWGTDHFAERDPNVLFHDELSEHCTPFSLEDVVAHAAQHGLAYVGEALAQHWWEARASSTDAWRLRTAAGRDRVARQQYADWVLGLSFKATVLTRADRADPPGALDPARVAGLWVAGVQDPAPLPDGAPAEIAAVAAVLESAWPDAVPFAELHERAGAELPAAAVGRALLARAAAEQARLYLEPPRFAAAPGQRPEASPLARVQAALGSSVATLRHDHIAFEEPLGRVLVALLDGSRDRGAIAADLARAARTLGAAEGVEEAIADGLDENLRELAALALLVR